MVLLAQCLCPARHCIFANASDELDAATLEDALKTGLDTAIVSGAFNPWCALCRAPRQSWRIEVKETGWNTLEEAMPHLRASEADQLVTQQFYKHAAN